MCDFFMRYKKWDKVRLFERMVVLIQIVGLLGIVMLSFHNPVAVKWNVDEILSASSNELLQDIVHHGQRYVAVTDCSAAFV